MQQIGKKNIIGIMGGIASGKSTVAKELAKRGCAVIDADKIAKRFLGNKDVKKQIRGAFGRGVFDVSGRVSRKKLAERVFADAKAVKAINAIIHPIVFEKTKELIKKYRQQPAVKAIVLDMPLLVEVGWHKKCDKLIFVQCNKKIRLKRARKKGIFGENELKKRENFQISLDKKARISDNIIDNNSDELVLVRQVADIFSRIVNNG